MCQTKPHWSPRLLHKRIQPFPRTYQLCQVVDQIWPLDYELGRKQQCHICDSIEVCTLKINLYSHNMFVLTWYVWTHMIFIYTHDMFVLKWYVCTHMICLYSHNNYVCTHMICLYAHKTMLLYIAICLYLHEASRNLFLSYRGILLSILLWCFKKTWYYCKYIQNVS